MADWGDEGGGGDDWGQGDLGGAAMDAGGEDWNATETAEEREAKLEKQLFGEVRSAGVDFGIYGAIEVSIQEGDEKCPPPCTSFDDMGIGEGIKANIARMNYKEPTPIQKAAVPITLGGRDLMASAQTGSGKTGAFMFSIIQQILPIAESEERKTAATSSLSMECAIPLALIVTPTRELAIQIKIEAMKFAFKMPIRPCLAYGGQPRGTQIRDFLLGCDILIATPGRLKDFIEAGKVSLKATKILVLDEADRMLDDGFGPDIDEIVDTETSGLPEDHQTLMFSATFEEDMQEAAQNYLKNHAFVQIGRVGSSTELITQQLIRVEGDFNEKVEKLMELVMTHANAKRILVFVETKQNAEDLDRYLDGAGIYATSIHGNKNQQAREKALNNFARGQLFLLVATDVAARGLDIDGIDVVINFDMPSNVDSYTHRIGRTGRCGRRGLAISFIGSRTKQEVLEEVKRLMEETGEKNKEAIPEYLDSLIEEAGSYSGGGGGCRQWKEGTCERGDECRFDHEGEAGTPPEGWEPRRGGGGGECYAWARGECDKDDCRFDHVGEAGAGGGGGGGRGGGECYAWGEGRCTRGEDCRFEHIGEEGAGGSGKKQECNQWKRGECTRGETCRFEHVGPEGGEGGGDFGGGFGGSAADFGAPEPAAAAPSWGGDEDW